MPALRKASWRAPNRCRSSGERLGVGDEAGVGAEYRDVSGQRALGGGELDLAMQASP
jgi:hypothetical protein